MIFWWQNFRFSSSLLSKRRFACRQNTFRLTHMVQLWGMLLLVVLISTLKYAQQVRIGKWFFMEVTAVTGWRTSASFFNISIAAAQLFSKEIKVRARVSKLDSQLVQELIVFVPLRMALYGTTHVLLLSIVWENAGQHRRTDVKVQWFSIWRILRQIFRNLRPLRREIASWAFLYLLIIQSLILVASRDAPGRNRHTMHVDWGDVVGWGPFLPEALLPLPQTVLGVTLLLRGKAQHVAIIAVILQIADRIILLGVVMRGLHRKLRALKKVRVMAWRATRVVLALEGDRIGRVTAHKVLQRRQTWDRRRLIGRGHMVNVGRQDRSWNLMAGANVILYGCFCQVLTEERLVLIFLIILRTLDLRKLILGALHGELLLALRNCAHGRQLMQLWLGWSWWRVLHDWQDVGLSLRGCVIEGIWRDF